MVKEELTMRNPLFIDFPHAGHQFLIVLATQSLFIKELLAPVLIGLQVLLIPNKAIFKRLTAITGSRLT